MAKARRSAAALAVAAGIFLSRIAGLVRERIFAHYLGNSLEAGAFKAALRIPNLLQNLLGEGALSASFIPAYARLLGAGDEKRASELASVIGSFLVLGTAIFTALGVLFAGPLTSVVAMGFVDSARALTVDLVRIIFAGVGLLVVSAYCLGVLNSHRRFFLSYVAPVLWNATQIAALIYFGRRIGAGDRASLAVDLAWATLVGAGLQLLVQVPTTLRLLRTVKPSLQLTPEAREVLRNFGPAVTARGVVQISAFLDQALVSFLSAGMTAAMAYAQQIYLLPVSLFGMAISASELPELARSVGQRDNGAGTDSDGKTTHESAMSALAERLGAGLRRMSFFVVPCAVAMAGLGNLIIGALFQTGAFHAKDTVVVWMILGGASVGLVAATRARLYSSALYALSDARTPLRFAIARVAFGAALGSILAFVVRPRLELDERFGAAALTLASGCAGWVEYSLLRRAVQRKVGAIPAPARETLMPWIAAILAMGIAAWLGQELVQRPLLIATLGPLAMYGVMYLGFAWVLGVREARGLVVRVTRRGRDGD